MALGQTFRNLHVSLARRAERARGSYHLATPRATPYVCVVETENTVKGAKENAKSAARTKYPMLLSLHAFLVNRVRSVKEFDQYATVLRIRFVIRVWQENIAREGLVFAKSATRDNFALSVPPLPGLA